MLWSMRKSAHSGLKQTIQVVYYSLTTRFFAVQYSRYIIRVHHLDLEMHKLICVKSFVYQEKLIYLYCGKVWWLASLANHERMICWTKLYIIIHILQCHWFSKLSYTVLCTQISYIRKFDVVKLRRKSFWWNKLWKIEPQEYKLRQL